MHSLKSRFELKSIYITNYDIKKNTADYLENVNFALTSL